MSRSRSGDDRAPRLREASGHRQRQRRQDGIDKIALSLTARGLTTREVAAHFDVYGARVSKDTILKITDKVIEEMTQWSNRPLDRVYPGVFIDATCDRSIRRRPRLP